MSAKYEETGSARFTVETIDGQEQITIPAPRNFFVMAFIPIWLVMWTIGGVSAFNAMMKSFQPFLLFWLCAWALGEAFALATVLWMYFGVEIIRVAGFDLDVSYRLLGFVRHKLYRGTDIRNLSSAETPWIFRYNQMSLPFLGANKTGSVKFSYGARTVYLAAGLDESEGRMIVAQLRKRLPASVG